jgi:predicted nucleotidyltransferase
MPEPTADELIEAMKDAAAVLQDAEIPFLLGGGLAAWAHGGPMSEHDVDLLVRPADAEAALAAFDRHSFRTERPPEGWLYKARHENGTTIDLIFDPAGGAVDDEMFERASLLEVVALRVRVATLEDVLTSKLLAIHEQEPTFDGVLELARALREQVDWDAVRDRTSSSPFALAFFTLIEELGILS